jgi:RHS repeat-associated protein
VTKTYFYDINGSVIAECEAASGTGYGYGVLKRLNVSAGGRLLAVDEVQTNGTKVTSYLMGDRQGSTRVLTDAAGAVTSRHHYLPFGEELGAGTGGPGSPTGMRTTSQGYSVADSVRQRYADTRLDDATGLDHTLWRKLETRSGRWSTPDPYGASLRVADPQSFNRYAYVHNDPMNFADPTGLDEDPIDPWDGTTITTDTWGRRHRVEGMMGDDTGMMIELPSSDGPGGGEGEPQNPLLEPVGSDTRERLNNALDLLVSMLEDGPMSENCQKNVIDRLARASSQGGIGFDLAGFTNYLKQGATYYDGTISQLTVAGNVASQQVADLLYGPGATVAGVFASRPGLNALASITASTFTLFLRPDAVDSSNSGANSRNRGLLFHEGIHGFTGRVDEDIQSALGITVDRNNTGNITQHIRDNCF